jgi:hypothetical protein
MVVAEKAAVQIAAAEKAAKAAVQIAAAEKAAAEEKVAVLLAAAEEKAAAEKVVAEKAAVQIAAAEKAAKLAGFVVIIIRRFRGGADRRAFFGRKNRRVRDDRLQSDGARTIPR